MEKREEIKIGFCCIMICLLASQLFWEEHWRSEGTLTFCNEVNYIIANNSNIYPKFSNICVLIIIVTVIVTRKRQVFLNSCLRGPIRTFWSKTISKEELYRWVAQITVAVLIWRRKDDRVTPWKRAIAEYAMAIMSNDWVSIEQHDGDQGENNSNFSRSPGWSRYTSTN